MVKELFVHIHIFFIIQVFQTLVFIFMAIFTTFRPICPPAFLQVFSVELGILHGTSNHILYLIQWRGSLALISTISVKYSCIITRLQSGLNQRPPDNCLFRSLGNKLLLPFHHVHDIRTIFFIIILKMFRPLHPWPSLRLLCWTRERTQNFESNPISIPWGWIDQIPLTMTGYMYLPVE